MTEVLKTKNDKKLLANSQHKILNFCNKKCLSTYLFVWYMLKYITVTHFLRLSVINFCLANCIIFFYKKMKKHTHKRKKKTQNRYIEKGPHSSSCLCLIDEWIPQTCNRLIIHILNFFPSKQTLRVK